MLGRNFSDYSVEKIATSSLIRTQSVSITRATAKKKVSQDRDKCFPRSFWLQAGQKVA